MKETTKEEIIIKVSEMKGKTIAVYKTNLGQTEKVGLEVWNSLKKHSGYYCLSPYGHIGIDRCVFCERPLRNGGMA